MRSNFQGMTLESEFWTHLPAFLPTTEHGNKQSVAWDHQISWDWGKCLITLPAFSSRDHPMNLKQKNSLHTTCQTMKLLPQGIPGAQGLHKTKFGGAKSTAGIKCKSSTWAIPGMPPPHGKLCPWCFCAPSLQLELTVNISSTGCLWGPPRLSTEQLNTSQG